MESKRKVLQDRYHIIEIFECPTDVIIFAASLGAEYVTVENVRPLSNQNISFFLTIKCSDDVVKPLVKKMEVDLLIGKNEFILLEPIWHSNGCYAVFHGNSELKFKATDLTGISKYRALDNFGWNLEVAIPGSASDGWGHIASPNKSIIDTVEIFLREIQK